MSRSALFIHALLATGLSLTLLVLPQGARDAAALAPARELTQYSRQTWTSREGLPQDSIQAITQTEDGYLWLATPAGVLRFDGMRFEPIGEGRTAPDVWSLIRGRDGTLWMGTEGGGLLGYRDGQFSVFDEARGLTSPLVRTLVEARDGALWIATDGGGVNRLEMGRLSSIRARDGLPSDRVWSLCEDRRGRLWIGTNGAGLAVLENGHVRAFARSGLYADPFVWAIHEDRVGTIWVGTSSGLLRIDAAGTTRFTKRDGLAGDTVRAILTDRDGSLWVGTTEGLSRLRNGSFETLAREEGLASRFVRSLFEDRDGNLWVGTYGGGLDLLRDGLFTAYGESEGISGAVVRPVLQSRDGSIWVGTNNGGVTRLDGERRRVWTTREGLSANVVTSACEDPAGRVWIGTSGYGLNVIERSGAVTHPRVRLHSPFVRTLHCAGAGGVWVGTSLGLSHISGTGVRTYRMADGLPDDFVRSFHVGPSGRVWIGTSHGLGILENGRLRAIGRENGLPGDLVHSVLEDEDGTAWIATNGGLVRLKNGVLRSVPLQPVMAEGLIHSIQADRQGHLWFSSARGVFRFRKALLEAVADGTSSRVSGSVYDSFDGMRTIECTGGGYHPLSARDETGRIWFATARGVVVVDPAAAAKLEPPPPVRLEFAVLEDRVLPLEPTTVIPPNPGRLAFHFGALSLVSPNNVTFRYRLEGYETEWIEATRGRVAVYTNLPPGAYTFRLAAHRREGPWSETPASTAFRIEAAFTETWGFTAVVAALVGLALWGGIRLRVRSLEARERHAEALTAERTRELREQIERRERIEEGLRESEERFRTFVERSADGIVLVDEEGRIIGWNVAMEQISGLLAEDVLGKPASDIKASALAAVAPPVAWDDEAELELEHADGSRLFVHQTNFRIPTTRGQRTGFVLRDVTARRRAELEREALINELEARNAELERFTYTVSHDLKSPLVTVQGFLGYIERSAAAGRMDELRSDIERIRRAIARMNELLGDLLELSRVGRITSPLEDLSFGAVAREAVEMVQGQVAEKGARIVIASELPRVRGDHRRLVEVVQNLLHNALKFSGDQKEPVVEVGCRGAEPGARAVLFVRDSGIGIDQRHLHRVFGLFEKLDPTVEGTGVGLAIVKRVIEVHGGRVWVESDGPGAGATFCFTLSLADASARPDAGTTLPTA